MEALQIVGVELDGENLLYLADMTNLRILILGRTLVSKEAVSILQKALPTCAIYAVEWKDSDDSSHPPMTHRNRLADVSDKCGRVSIWIAPAPGVTVLPAGWAVLGTTQRARLAHSL
jgi:hypothetical protein